MQNINGLTREILDVIPFIVTPPPRGETTSSSMGVAHASRERGGREGKPKEQTELPTHGRLL